MTRITQIESRKYIGASVSPCMVAYIKQLHETTGIGAAEYLRRLIRADMSKNQCPAMTSANASGLVSNITSM